MSYYIDVPDEEERYFVFEMLKYFRIHCDLRLRRFLVTKAAATSQLITLSLKI